MGSTSDDKWAEGWSPPTFEAGAAGKVIGAAKHRTPNDCRHRKFMPVAPPLNVTTASGSPVNPTAIL